MTNTTLKSMLASTILATGLSTFAFAQDASLKSDSELDSQPPAVMLGSETEAEIEIESNPTSQMMSPDTLTEEALLIEGNEDVLGAVETDDAYKLKTESDVSTQSASDDAEIKPENDVDSELDMEMIQNVSETDVEMGVESDIKTDVDWPE